MQRGGRNISMTSKREETKRKDSSLENLRVLQADALIGGVLDQKGWQKEVSHRACQRELETSY